MRKSIVTQESPDATRKGINWLDIESIARVEITSEDPLQPIESALQPIGAPGWCADASGPQRIRVLFDHPQRISRVYLLISEEEVGRTQEFVLRYAQDGGETFREIVRQQFTFAPPGTTVEQEEYQVELAGVTALELEIVPDLSGGTAKAKLGRLLFA
ncbi:hypothetical protein [Geomonas ferrireducens]|uniref:hypothetical protein n=1 Tax=Geomonas ferrireducens TaxID=2570227 RepID=UPI0010A92AA1|nr:hypothetical protein [Geomonas ferrireducens]